MPIQKPYMICPKCFTEDRNSLSLFDEKIECSECGALSDRAEYIAMKSRKDFSADPQFPSAFLIEDGDDWSLKLKPRHFERVMSMLLFRILPGLGSIYLLFIGNPWATFPLLLGIWAIWDLLHRSVGSVRFILVGDRLTYFKGIGAIGFSGSIQWSRVSNIRYDPKIARLCFDTPAGDKENKGYESVYFDLSSQQLTYVENFLYEKIDVREKISARQKKNSLVESGVSDTTAGTSSQHNTKTIYCESGGNPVVKILGIAFAVSMLILSVSPFLMRDLDRLYTWMLTPFVVMPAVLLAVIIPAFTNLQKNGRSVLKVDAIKSRLGGRVSGVVHGFAAGRKPIQMLMTLKLVRAEVDRYDRDFRNFHEIFSTNAEAKIIRAGDEIEGRLLVEIPIPAHANPSKPYDGKEGFYWKLIIQPVDGLPLTKHKIEFPIEVGEQIKRR